MNHLRRGWVLGDDGMIVAPMENIWDRAKRWARRHGKAYVPTYGVVGVAPL
jgi:hypothetical protein